MGWISQRPGHLVSDEVVRDFESKLTGMRSAYFWRIRSASALRFSKGCSSLNLDRMADKAIVKAGLVGMKLGKAGDG